ncbi:hypothetical protein SISSUDRAFT_472618 [Sistotremastrum suecicum HHB10207 ss-3]|uniref:Mediator of RNA polymerase II transcription subunit 12 n=1 Tax=Sistotremastrum suecicum HHB10207 ss-3 TaxID=1314776 RepID=A0A165Y456_9AGAM|nr:hypothetical protein SISSUDRAFT_472618 [Sistotremastrum suecicum HHB10207 ss-3]
MPSPGPSSSEPIGAYVSKPAEWLPQIHKSADLGYYGFHPPRPDQEEDQLNEKFVREGFSSSYSVDAERHSALDDTKRLFPEPATFTFLENLLHRVFEIRAEQAPQIPPPSFKLPGRATLPEARRLAWVNDLANPNIPLQKLGRSVPSGFKGHDLLDMLQTNNVTIPRAVWYIRVLGGNEIQGMKNRVGFQPSQYSVEWTMNLLSYLKKLLADIALPSAPRAGLNIKQIFKSTFTEPESRDKWVSKCSYFLNLLRACYAEGMVDQCTFLSWLALQPGASNLPQMALITKLLDEYLEPLSHYRVFARPVIDECLAKLKELNETKFRIHLHSTAVSMESIILRLFVMIPDAFVCVKMWRAHSALVTQTIADQERAHAQYLSGQLPFNSHTGLDIAGLFREIERRNDAISFLKLPQRTGMALRLIMDDVEALNAISFDTDLSSINCLTRETMTGDLDTLLKKLDTLLTWAILPTQYGHHRPYIATTLVIQWRTRMLEMQTQGEFPSHDPREFLQDALFDWLESCDRTHEKTNVPHVAYLYGELIRRDAFSYEKYVQRLIARGESLEVAKEDRTCHSDFLRYIPLNCHDAGILRQRKVILYGHRARTTPEDEVEKNIREELKTALPVLFGGEPREMDLGIASFSSRFPSLLSASPFEQQKILKHWLFPLVQAYVKNQVATKKIVDVESYCIAMEVMSITKCYPILLEAVFILFKNGFERPLFDAGLECILRFSDIWSAMGEKPRIAAQLSKAIAVWKAKEVDLRPLLHLFAKVNLLELVTPAAQQHIQESKTTLFHLLRPENPSAPSIPPRLTELLQLMFADDIGDQQAAWNLAHELWVKYKSSANFGWVLWDNAFASLRQITAIHKEAEKHMPCARLYATFLYHLHELMPGDFDSQVRNWLTGSGKGELAALSSDTWPLFAALLLDLVVRGALQSSTVIIGVLCPAWRIHSSPVVPLPPNTNAMLRACQLLGTRLLLCSQREKFYGSPALALRDMQRLFSQREAFVLDGIFQQVLESIPTLVALELHPGLEDDIKTSMTNLRLACLQSSLFRRLICKKPDHLVFAVKKALASADYSLETRRRIISAAKVVIDGHPEMSDLESDPDDSICDWETITSRLTPWDFAKTTAKVQLTLCDFERDATSGEAHEELEKFTAGFFDRPTTPEQTDLVADVVRGITGVVASKFLDAGLTRLTGLLNELPLNVTTEDAEGFLRNAGENLRLLAKAIGPSKRDDHAFPEPSKAIQDALVVALTAKLPIMDLLAKVDDVTDADQLALNESVKMLSIFLCRILQFILCLSGSWSPELIKNADPLRKIVIRAAMRMGGGAEVDPQCFVLFLDTAAFLIDEMPKDPKNPDVFQTAVALDPRTIPGSVPHLFRGRLAALLSFVREDPLVQNLAHVPYDASATHLVGLQVVSRPWEWVDYSELPTDPQERPGIKNAGSVSLEHFEARATGETLAKPGDPHVSSAIKSFQDSFSQESIFERDWRESRIDMRHDSPDAVDRNRSDDGESHHSHQSKSGRGRSAASPAPSALSRSSGRASSLSRKQSPGQTRPAASEVIDVDSLPSSALASDRGKKRKASNASLFDEDVAVVDGPSSGSSRGTAAKRGKTKSTPTSKSKKK